MTILFGISNCSTVKKARSWLDEKQIEYQFHDFRKDGINSEQVQRWSSMIPRASLINKRSTTWKNLSESEQDQVINGDPTAILLAHPTLIKRPLLSLENECHVGFSAQQYEQLLGTGE